MPGDGQVSGINFGQRKEQANAMPQDDDSTAYVTREGEAMTGRAFLEQLAERLLTQDRMAEPDGPTHATARPLYTVQQRVRIYGVDPDYTGGDEDTHGYEWVFEGETYHPDDDETMPAGVERVPYLERWEAVEGAVSFTRQGIEDYLAADRHNLNKPRIWVASVPRRCWDTVRLMEILETIPRWLEEPEAIPELRCSDCGWEGAESDLIEPCPDEPPECPDCGGPFEGLDGVLVVPDDDCGAQR